MSENVAHALTGALGGAIAMAATYPLTVIGTRLQMEQRPSATGQAQDQQSTATDGSRGRRSDWEEAKSVAQHIYEKEGLVGFYQGLGSALFGMSVSNGIYYFYYEWARDLLATSVAADGNKVLSTARGLFAGTLAGTATACLTNPIWVVNTRLIAAAKAGKPSTVGKIIKDMMRDETGLAKAPKPYNLDAWERLLRALFQGLGPALILVINPTLQYGAFEQFRSWVSRWRPLTNFDFFLLGALSKLLATLITYPYIILKTRLQLKSSATSSSSSSLSSSSSSTTSAAEATTMQGMLQNIIREHGLKGLYTGLTSKAIQSVLTAAILFYAKESLFQFTVNLIGQKKARQAIVKAY